MITKNEPKSIIDAEKSIKEYFAKMFPETHSDEAIKKLKGTNYYKKNLIKKIKRGR